MNRSLLRSLAVLAAVSGLAGCSAQTEASGEPRTRAPITGEAAVAPVPPEGLAYATFAGGCFWCMEEPFDVLPGVHETISGYSGGAQLNPTYKQVSAGRTDHAEVVQILYDPEKVTYEKLLQVFWHNIDPTVEDRQFCDWGSQYRTAIYAHDDEQLRLAEASKQAILDAGTVAEIVTEIAPATAFYPAEDYHQNFYETNPVRYKTYRIGCGRDRRLADIWGEAAGH